MDTTWREIVRPYAQPHLGRSILDIATSVVPYLGLMVAMYLALDVSYWLVLALSVPAAGFLLRTYILFHDCTHGSFLPGKRANAVAGIFCGLVAFSDFYGWRHSHAVHHATAGDLERRGTGDVPTMTVAEYHAAPWGQRLMYRTMRSPWILFTIGPIYSLIIQPRMVSKDARPRIKRSVRLTNLALVVLVGGLCLLIGWQEFLAIQAPAALLAGSAGVFMFYVQHQFEDVYWESSDNWDFAEAGLRGSSFLDLPRVLHFFTGNIGYHHVHHLSARIPNYNLPRAHRENPELFKDVPTLSLWDGLRTMRLKLWDEDRGRLVTWAEGRESVAARAGGRGAAAPASS